MRIGLPTIIASLKKQKCFKTSDSKDCQLKVVGPRLKHEASGETS